MSDIQLSFCIPTYNRCDIVFSLVTSILSCSDEKIDVVVLDNGSTDDTLIKLSEIKDNRLKIFSNGENKGALFNMINVLDKATGDFVVYSTDQDHINPNGIKEFKDFLIKSVGLSCGYCELEGNHGNETAIFYEVGEDAILNLGYMQRHPTGYFFNNSFLKEIKILENYSNPDFVDLFPLEFVFSELSQVGFGAKYLPKLFSPEKGDEVVKHKSSTTNGVSKNAFFHPYSRLKMTVMFSNHLYAQSDLPDSAKKNILGRVFTEGLMNSTFGYKKILNDEKLCIHYYMNCRKIGFFEVTKNFMGFVFGFNKKFLSKEKKSPSIFFLLLSAFFYIFNKKINIKKVLK